jgi:hypothetical protein
MPATAEYTEQIVDRTRQAADANLATPGRDAAVVTLTPDLADEVMVTGDVHGHRKNFNQIRKVADLAAHPRRHLIIQEVIHGGPKYDNGGCMSHSLLEDVAKLKVDFPDRVHFLLSNHELSEVTGYAIQKGGTLLNLLFRLGISFVYGPETERVFTGYCQFIRTCPLLIRWDGVVVSHSVPAMDGHSRFDTGVFTRPWSKLDLDPHGGVFDLVWGRDYSEENARAFASLVGANVLLGGHEPTEQGFLTPNSLQVIFDCCHTTACYAILPTNEPLDQQKVVARIQNF